MNRIIELINEDLKNKFLYESVRRLNRGYDPKEIDRRYDDLNLEQFLVFYKINRLEDLGIINEDVADNLRELQCMLISTYGEMGTELLKELSENEKYKSEILPKLHEKVAIIKSMLSKYNLNFEDIDFAKIISDNISQEKYPTFDDEPHRLVMEMRQKNKV